MSRQHDTVVLGDDPYWYKDAVIYELHVRAFCDWNGDGVGDFTGLVRKLDYLHDLGITAIWLLPFYPSPLRDDGYDISDYNDVNSSYGTLKDFKRFLREAHRRGIRVITELVINHTSSAHPWFEKSRRAAPGSRWRNYYVWSDTPEWYRDARVIFSDFETSNWTWDPVARAYYWHRFYSHQPDLNFASPEVRREVIKALDRWMAMGVDGMRLDAVPYLFEREGTNCENLPETHEFLKELRAHVDRKYKNRMLLAEANQWPEDAAEYFGNGDECHMNFHFPVMPRMFMAVQLENSFPIIDILEQTPTVPDSCQWAVFLRNHDELTLEMVTDEDRDYMYRVYAADPQARINVGIRRRLAPLLKMRNKIELMNGLLFGLPGTPVIYYGDEIGMGDNIYLGDRDGVRTPMQWSPDRNAGFSNANPQKLYLPVVIDPEHHYESVNVEAQQNNSMSLLWWMKKIIALRRHHPVFGRGDIEFLHPDNPKVLAFVRSSEEEEILCVYNLSRFPQYVELELRRWEGRVPVELFGRSEFPAIGELPYLLTLGAYGFYWFGLERVKVAAPKAELRGRPVVEVQRTWTKVGEGQARARLEAILRDYVVERRWFRGKARKLRNTALVDTVDLSKDGIQALLALVEVEYTEGNETYVLPLEFAQGERAEQIQREYPGAVIARLKVYATERGRREATGVLHDGLMGGRTAETMLAMFRRRRAWPGTLGQLELETYPGYRAYRGARAEDLTPRVSGAEQTNTSVVYGDRLILKVYRRIEEGENPDVEVGRFLSQQTSFGHVPPVVGSMHYRPADGRPASVALLQGYVPNQGDAWRMTLDMLDGFFERALAHPGTGAFAAAKESLIDRVGKPVPEVVADTIGAYLPLVRLLGQRTAEMHLALASDSHDPAFAPESFSTLHQRGLYQAARGRLRQTMQTLRRTQRKLPVSLRDHAKALIAQQDRIDAKLKKIVGRKIDTVRIRTHGDYHLGQVLYTGKDFVVIDFEGEPARSIGERRIKRSPLRDVAGMLRSFHYAVVTAFHQGGLRSEDTMALERAAELWEGWVSAAFVGSWLQVAADAVFVPSDREDLRTLIEFYVLDKCVYELGYELDNRPDWVGIPLRALEALAGIETSET